MKTIFLALFLSSFAFAGQETGSADQVLRIPGAGGRPRYGQVDLSKSAAVKNQLPIANGGTGQSTQSAAFDALSPNTTKGDLTIRSNTSNIRLGIGSDTQVLTADSSQTSGVKWAAVPPPSLSVTSKTANYTAVSTDDVILVSGGSFTITLPSAASAGKLLRIKKTDSSLSNIITISTVSSQTIDGSGTSRTLNTVNEEYDLSSDGSGWQIVSHKTITPWASYSITSQGFGSMSSVNTQWRRVGGDIQIRGQAVTGTTDGNQAQLGFPTGVTTAAFGISSPMLAGYLSRTGTSAAAYTILINPSVTYFTVGAQSGSQNGMTQYAGNTLIASSENFSWFGQAPVSGWSE